MATTKLLRLLPVVATLALAPAAASAQPVKWWSVVEGHTCMPIADVIAALHGPAVSTPEEVRQIMIKDGRRVSPIRPAGDHAVVFESTLNGSTRHLYFFDSEHFCKAVLAHNGL